MSFEPFSVHWVGFISPKNNRNIRSHCTLNCKSLSANVAHTWCQMCWTQAFNAKSHGNIAIVCILACYLHLSKSTAVSQHTELKTWLLNHSLVFYNNFMQIIHDHSVSLWLLIQTPFTPLSVNDLVIKGFSRLPLEYIMQSDVRCAEAQIKQSN